MSLIFEDLTYNIIGACMNVHNALGFGFQEPVYQEALEIEFDFLEIPFIREKELSIEYRDKVLNKKYFVDFLCYEKIVVELKAVSELAKEHTSQVLNYLRASDLELGLLINFGSRSLKYKRIIL